MWPYVTGCFHTRQGPPLRPFHGGDPAQLLPGHTPALSMCKACAHWPLGSCSCSNCKHSNSQSREGNADRSRVGAWAQPAAPSLVVPISTHPLSPPLSTMTRCFGAISRAGGPGSLSRKLGQGQELPAWSLQQTKALLGNCICPLSHSGLYYFPGEML